MALSLESCCAVVRMSLDESDEHAVKVAKVAVPFSVSPAEHALPLLASACPLQGVDEFKARRIKTKRCKWKSNRFLSWMTSNNGASSLRHAPQVDRLKLLLGRLASSSRAPGSVNAASKQAPASREPTTHAPLKPGQRILLLAPHTYSNTNEPRRARDVLQGPRSDARNKIGRFYP